jgi:hypothetical protein
MYGKWQALRLKLAKVSVRERLLRSADLRHPVNLAALI